MYYNIISNVNILCFMYMYIHCFEGFLFVEYYHNNNYYK